MSNSTALTEQGLLAFGWAKDATVNINDTFLVYET